MRLSPDDESWLAAAVTRFVQREQAQGLPLISSALSAHIHALNPRSAMSDATLSSSARVQLYLDAIRSLALSYQPTLRSFAPYLVERGGAQTLNILSVCTGFDALVELVALTYAFGPITHYVSVELNEAATALNRDVCGDTGPHQCALRYLAADIRTSSWLDHAMREIDRFDLCIAFYPPITETAYSDMRRVNPGERLSNHSDSGVVLELLSIHEHGHLKAPIGMVFYAESEAQYLEFILRVIGYDQGVDFRAESLSMTDFCEDAHGTHIARLDALEYEIIRYSACIDLQE